MRRRRSRAAVDASPLARAEARSAGPRPGLAVCGAVCMALLLACGSEPPAPENSEPAAFARLSDAPRERAVLEIRDLGRIEIELLPELAPETVAAFKRLVADGFYDGTSFHRVIPGFVIQGGDPNTKNHDPRDDGKGGPGFTLPHELSDLPQTRGVVSMAHKGQDHTAGSQFFIVHEDSPGLTGRYTAFGRVVSGMDVVDAITELEIDTYGRYGPRNRPYPVPAVIESAHILPAAGPARAAAHLPPSASRRDGRGRPASVPGPDRTAEVTGPGEARASSPSGAGGEAALPEAADGGGEEPVGAPSQVAVESGGEPDAEPASPRLPRRAR